MRSIDVETRDALLAAPELGISVRNFVWFELVDGSTFGFHSDIDPALSLEMIDGQTGNVVTRTYYGDGSIQRMGQIILSTGLTIRRASLDLSNIHPIVNDMVRGHSVRNARVEIHRGVVSTSTGEFVNRPVIHFNGFVNTAEPVRGIVGSGGGIAVDCASITRELTRTNPAKASDVHQRTRTSDRFYQYNDIMGDVKVVWGGKEGS